MRAGAAWEESSGQEVDGFDRPTHGLRRDRGLGAVAQNDLVPAGLSQLLCVVGGEHGCYAVRVAPEPVDVRLTGSHPAAWPLEPVHEPRHLGRQILVVN